MMSKLKYVWLQQPMRKLREALVPCSFFIQYLDPCFFFLFLVCSDELVLCFHLVREAVSIRCGHFVKAAVDQGRGRSILVIACFQERGEVCVPPRLLPPGNRSVVLAVALCRDAEHSDAQVGGDLEAHPRTVACEIN